MTVTASSFVVAFPEFEPTRATLVEAKLAEAERWTPANLYSSEATRDDAVSYLCARLLALSPEAKCLRTVKLEDGKTVYDERWSQIRRSAAGGFRVI